MTSTSAFDPDLSQIRWRLTRRYGVISIFVPLVFGGAVFLEVQRARTAMLREQVQQLASAAASQMPLILHETEEYRRDPSAQAKAESGPALMLETRATTLETKKIVLLDRRQQVLSQFGALPVDLQSLLPRRGLHQRQFLKIANGIAYWRPVVLRDSAAADGQLEGYVFAALSSSSSDREMLRLRNGLLLGGVLGAMAAAALSQWMVASSLQPIRDQIRRLLRFTSDASHELRHPLTAIRAVIGAARERGLLDRAEPLLLEKFNLMDQAATEMTSLVEDLLLLTRLDRAVPEQRHWRPFELCDLVEDLIALYQDRAASQQIELLADLQRPALLNGHPDQLRRLISNLLVNGLQFTPAGGWVRAQVKQQGAAVQLVVEDSGPGIPVEQCRLVFERFWQADAARMGSNAGLGLSIARSIAEVHGGTIEAQAGSCGGCRMVLQLPGLIR